MRVSRYTSTTVYVSREEVAAFAAKWPCFGSTRSLRFEFDDGGNLVDIAGDEEMDPSGVAALVEDVRAFAKIM